MTTLTTQVAAGLAEHQLRMLAKARECGWRAALLAEPRTGKTAASLAAAEEAKCQRLLVVGPSIAAGVWRAEAERIGFSLPVYLALENDLSRRAANLKTWLAEHPHGMVVTNYQSFWRPKMLPLLKRWRPDGIIADEVSALKTRTSHQSREMWALGQLPSVRLRLGLTGTPITNSPQDLFGIYRFIRPELFGLRWRDFADDFLTFGYFNEVTGSKNDAEIRRRLDLVSIQVPRSQAWGGLPHRTDQVWPVILSEESSQRYRQFARDAVMAIDQSVTESESGTVSASLIITQAMRLHQLTSGHTKLDDGRVVDLSSEKIDAAVELAQQTIDAGEQVAVFAVFRREIARLHERLDALYPGKVAIIQGGDDSEERTQRIDRFRRGELRVLVLQIHVGSMAIDLSTASVAIIASTGYSLEQFEQARERLTGTDPNRSFAFYYLQAAHADGMPTIDGKIYKVLINKQRIAGKFLSLDYAHRLFSDG